MLNLELFAGVNGVLLLLLNKVVVPLDVDLLLLFYFLFYFLWLQRLEGSRGLWSLGLV